MSNNRKFWKTIKRYFSNKGLNSNKLLLKEKSNLVSDENELATIFITKDLEQKKDSKGKLNNLEDVLKAFEFRQVLKKSTNLSTLQKSSVFAM